MAKFDLENYVSVNDRIKEFWEKYPDGRIDTQMIEIDAPDIKNRLVVVKAYIYKQLGDRSPAATGIAKEREGTAGANTTSFVENCETSAIGRGLANLGIAIDKNRASREEMVAVERQEEAHQDALNRIKAIGITNEALRAKIKTNWDEANSNPVFAHQFLGGLEQEVLTLSQKVDSTDGSH